MSGPSGFNEKPPARNPAGGKMEQVWLRLGQPKPQLGIEIDIVVPGQPVGGIQLAVGQAQHLGEAGGNVIDPVDHSFGRNNVLITLDLHQSIVDACTSDANAFSGGQGVGAG